MSRNQITALTVSSDEIYRFPDDSVTERNVCLVTGAVSGIGRATTLAAAGNGLTAAATDIDEDGLAGTIDRGEDLGLEGTIESVPGDLTNDAEVIEDVMLGQPRVTEMIEPIDVANLFLLGFSELGRHLDGGDLLFDGGLTRTYE